MSSLKGLDKLLKDLDNMPAELENAVDSIVEDNARQLERSAKRFAPVDTGKLRQSIIAAKSGELSWKVYVGEKYGAYIEFGTGGLVQVPEELREMALKFKGKGVRTVNLRPQPYLYPAFELQRDDFYNDIKQMLETKAKSI